MYIVSQELKDISGAVIHQLRYYCVLYAFHLPTHSPPRPLIPHPAHSLDTMYTHTKYSPDKPVVMSA